MMHETTNIKKSLYKTHRSLSAHGEPSAVRSSRAHQRTAEAWLYLPREMNRIFWVVANSSVSTHLTVVLIMGHNDESTICHTSQSRLGNSESSRTFEVFVHAWTHCICSSVRFLGTHLAHTRCICSISVTMCWVRSKEIFSEAESSRNVNFGHFPIAAQTWQYWHP